MTGLAADRMHGIPHFPYPGGGPPARPLRLSLCRVIARSIVLTFVTISPRGRSKLTASKIPGGGNCVEIAPTYTGRLYTHDCGNRN